jgi:hypothetical protein
MMIGGDIMSPHKWNWFVVLASRLTSWGYNRYLWQAYRQARWTEKGIHTYRLSLASIPLCSASMMIAPYLITLYRFCKFFTGDADRVPGASGFLRIYPVFLNPAGDSP